MKITPKNWPKFQHYKNRKPPWIKLYRELLDDCEFACLPVASMALAPRLWLLASEYEKGEITSTVKQIAFRLRMSEGDFAKAVTCLIETGFFICDSEMLAECKQLASKVLATERERDGETERNKDQKPSAAPQNLSPENPKENISPSFDCLLDILVANGDTEDGARKFLGKQRKNFGIALLDKAALETMAAQPKEYKSYLMSRLGALKVEEDNRKSLGRCACV